MKKPKVILLRGKQNSGKNGTMCRVYQKLIDRGYILIEGDSPVYECPLPDFTAIMAGKNKKIGKGKKTGLICNGDEYAYPKETMAWFIENDTDIIVACTRTQDREHSAYRVYQEFEAAGKIQIVHEEWTEKTENKAQQTKSHQEVAGKIVDKIEEIINA